jgi:outer membrane autotransporter protein
MSDGTSELKIESIAATGSIEAESVSAYARGINSLNDLTITNGIAGTITATSQNYGGVGISASGVITISGGISGTITGTGNNWEGGGIYAFDSLHIAGAVSGTIAANDPTGDAWTLWAANDLNGGDTNTPLLITGSVTANGATGAWAVEAGNINLKVGETGTISAISSGGDAYAILSDGSGNDEVSLVAGCTIVGDIDLGAGSADVLNLSGTTGTTTFSDDITGVEAWFIDSGTWCLNGNATNTLVDVSGGIWRGTGTITGLLLNRSIVAPGNSIGTMNVNGDFNQLAEGTLQIEINDSGGTDLLAVTGDVELNGTVDVQAESGTYADGMTYDFLTYGGTRTGTFSSVTDNLPFLNAELVYGTGVVQILLVQSHTPYVDVAQTYNQRSVAAYLDAHKAGATGDLVTVLTELDSLTSPAARTAFNATSGEIYGSLSTVGIENHESFLGEIALQLRSRSLNRGRFGLASSSADSLRKLDQLQTIVRGQNECDDCGCSGCNKIACCDHQAWISGYGIGANLAGNGNASGLNYSTGGTAFGLERYVNACTLLGFAAGYSQTGVHLDDRFDRSTIDSGQLALYFHRDTGNSYATGIAAYAYNDYDSSRQVTVGTIARRATAKYGGNAFSFYVERGRNFYFRRATFQPFAALEYIQLHQNGFTESGADSLNLTVGGVGADAFRSLLGSRIASDFRLRGGRLLSLEGRALWRHEFLDEARVLDASFAGQPGSPFVVDGINVDRDTAILGTGLTLYLNRHAKLYTNYDILTSTNYTAHAGTAGLMLAW